MSLDIKIELTLAKRVINQNNL